MTRPTMAENNDVVEFVKYLESGDPNVVAEFKQVIYENLHSSKDGTFLNALLESYIQNKSTKLLEILAGVKGSHCQYLFERMNELLKHGMYTEICSLLGAIIQRQPSWLHKIVGHTFFAQYLKCLKEENDVVFVMSGSVIISMLLPCVPSLIAPHLGEILQIFIRMASFLVNKPGSLPEVFILHLQVGVYILFQRLYSMYPNNFISYLRSCFGSRTSDPVFRHVVEPMMQFVKFHSGLVLDTLKSETENSKWKTFQPHDVYAECQKFSLDPLDAIKEAIYSVFPQKSFSQESLYPQKSATNSALSKNDKIIIENVEKNLSQDQKATIDQTTRDHYVPYLSSQELSLFWSPSFLCGLSTPPSSRPTSPAGSTQDIPSLSEFVQRPMTPLAAIELKDINNSDDALTSTPLVSRRRSGGELKKSSQKTSPMLTLGLKSKSAEAVDTVGPEADKEQLRQEVTSKLVAQEHSKNMTRKSKENLQERTKVVTKHSPRLTRSELLDSSSSNKTSSAPNTPSSQSKETFSFAFTQSSQETTPSQAHPGKRVDSANTATTLPSDRRSMRTPQQSQNVIMSESPLHELSVNLLEVIKDLQGEAISKQNSFNANLEDGIEESDRYCTKLKLKSPFELLDEFIECGSNLHSLQLSRIPLTSQLDTDWTYYGGASPADELSILKAQLSLIEVQLQYERHKCNQHVLRNRRLVGKVHKAQAIENELNGLRNKNILLNNELLEAELGLKRKDNEIRQLRDFIVDSERQKSEMQQKLLEENRKLTYEVKELSEQINFGDKDKAEMKMQLKKVKHELFEALSEVKSMKPKLEINSTVQAKAENIAKELATFQDMYERIKEQINRFRTNGVQQNQILMERNALQNEIEEYKIERESYLASLESAKLRISDLESLLSKKDLAMRDHKADMDSLCHQHAQDIKVLEERYKSLKKATQGMESYILYLLKKLEDSGRTMHPRHHKTCERIVHQTSVESHDSNTTQCNVLSHDFSRTQELSSSTQSTVRNADKARVDDSGIQANEAD